MFVQCTRASRHRAELPATRRGPSRRAGKGPHSRRGEPRQARPAEPGEARSPDQRAEQGRRAAGEHGRRDHPRAGAGLWRCLCPARALEGAWLRSGPGACAALRQAPARCRGAGAGDGVQPALRPGLEAGLSALAGHRRHAGDAGGRHPSTPAARDGRADGPCRAGREGACRADPPAGGSRSGRGLLRPDDRAHPWRGGSRGRPACLRHEQGARRHRPAVRARRGADRRRPAVDSVARTNGATLSTAHRPPRQRRRDEDAAGHAGDGAGALPDPALAIVLEPMANNGSPSSPTGAC